MRPHLRPCGWVSSEGSPRQPVNRATAPSRREACALARRYQRDAVRIDTVRRDEPHGDIEYRAVRVAPNELENAVAGDNVIVVDASRSMIHASNDKLLVLQGLDNFIVVDTKDVLLICKRDKEQEIKEYVAEVKRNKGDQYL